MQLMPEVIGDYRVKDPFSAKQSILAGAKLLKVLENQYGGDPHAATVPADKRSVESRPARSYGRAQLTQT